MIGMCICAALLVKLHHGFIDYTECRFVFCHRHSSGGACSAPGSASQHGSLCHLKEHRLFPQSGFKVHSCGRCPHSCSQQRGAGITIRGVLLCNISGSVPYGGEVIIASAIQLVMSELCAQCKLKTDCCTFLLHVVGRATPQGKEALNSLTTHTDTHTSRLLLCN